MQACRQNSHTHKIKGKGNLKCRSVCRIDSLIDSGRVFEALWIPPPRHSEQLGRKFTNPWDIFTTKQGNTVAPQTSLGPSSARRIPNSPGAPLERTTDFCGELRNWEPPQTSVAKAGLGTSSSVWGLSCQGFL